MSCWAHPLSFFCTPSGPEPEKPRRSRLPLPSACAPRHGEQRGERRGVGSITNCIGSGAKGQQLQPLQLQQLPVLQQDQEQLQQQEPVATSIGSSSNDAAEVPLKSHGTQKDHKHSTGSVSAAGQSDSHMAKNLRSILPSQSPQWIAELAERTGRSPESVQQELKAMEDAAVKAGASPYAPFEDQSQGFRTDTESSFSMEVTDSGNDNGAGAWGPNEAIPEGDQRTLWILAYNIHTRGRRMVGQMAFLAGLLTLIAGVSAWIAADTSCDLSPIDPWVWGSVEAIIELSMAVIYVYMLHCLLRLLVLHDAQASDTSAAASAKEGKGDEPSFWVALTSSSLHLGRARTLLRGVKLACGLLAVQLLWALLGLICAVSGFGRHSDEGCLVIAPAILGLLCAGACMQPYVQCINYLEMRRRIPQGGAS
mmetsp:Transcript_6643/g.14490  ORF Transcript_6643/g.14490 Transcript_6643/m.14490 type:complete len:423 (-) Transcript_6643:109-1377(-)